MFRNTCKGLSQMISADLDIPDGSCCHHFHRPGPGPGSMSCCLAAFITAAASSLKQLLLVVLRTLVSHTGTKDTCF